MDRNVLSDIAIQRKNKFLKKNDMIIQGGYLDLKYPLGKFIVLHQTAISVLSTMIQQRR